MWSPTCAEPQRPDARGLRGMSCPVVRNTSLAGGAGPTRPYHRIQAQLASSAADGAEPRQYRRMSGFAIDVPKRGAYDGCCFAESCLADRLAGRRSPDPKGTGCASKNSTATTSLAFGRPQRQRKGAQDALRLVTGSGPSLRHRADRGYAPCPRRSGPIKACNESMNSRQSDRSRRVSSAQATLATIRLRRSCVRGA